MRRPFRELGKVPPEHEIKLLQKIENSGNEAKKWLKTKEVTSLNGAHFACFACKFAPNRDQNAPKYRILRKTKPAFPVGDEIETVTNSRLQRTAARLHKSAGPAWICLENPEVGYNAARFVISQRVEKTQSEIPRFARNDSRKKVFTQSLKPSRSEGDINLRLLNRLSTCSFSRSKGCSGRREGE